MVSYLQSLTSFHLFPNRLHSQVLGIQIQLYLLGSCHLTTAPSVTRPGSAILPDLPVLPSRISIDFLIPTLPLAHKLCSLPLIVVFHVVSLPSMTSRLFFTCLVSKFPSSVFPTDPHSSLSLVPSLSAFIVPWPYVYYLLKFSCLFFFCIFLCPRKSFS